MKDLKDIKKETSDKKSKFKDRILTFFLYYDTNTLSLFKKHYPKLIAIVAFIFIFALTNDFNKFLYNSNLRDDALVNTLSEQNEEVLHTLEGELLHTHEGTYQEYLVHGADSTYLAYYLDGSNSPEFIYDTNKNEWLDKEPLIPFVVYKAFRELKLEAPQTYVDDVVTTETSEYEVSVNPFKVEVDDVGVYTLSPILPRRVEKFAEEYSGEKIIDMEILNIFRMDSYELIYLQGKDKTYQLRSYFNETAQISEVIDGYEFITQTNN